jgi:hypothetical protein
MATLLDIFAQVLSEASSRHRENFEIYLIKVLKKSECDEL